MRRLNSAQSAFYLQGQSEQGLTKWRKLPSQTAGARFMADAESDCSLGPRNRERSRVNEYYCPLCGLFIAASTNPQFLEIAIRAHVCPESLTFRGPASS